MKILETRELGVPDVKVIAFARFHDDRGYFTESFRDEQIARALGEPAFRVAQVNESFSRAGVVRGLHAQWGPHQGKLVRPVTGRLVDLALDIRRGSPTFGKLTAYAMSCGTTAEAGEWMWIPPGFAHGTYLTEDSLIEYVCTGPWNPEGEVSIAPESPTIDWSACDAGLAEEIRSALAVGAVMSVKDRRGTDLREFAEDSRSLHFLHAPDEPWGVTDRG